MWNLFQIRYLIIETQSVSRENKKNDVSLPWTIFIAFDWICLNKTTRIIRTDWLQGISTSTPSSLPLFRNSAIPTKYRRCSPTLHWSSALVGHQCVIEGSQVWRRFECLWRYLLSSPLSGIKDLRHDNRRLAHADTHAAFSQATQAKRISSSLSLEETLDPRIQLDKLELQWSLVNQIKQRFFCLFVD